MMGIGHFLKYTKAISPFYLGCLLFSFQFCSEIISAQEVLTPDSSIQALAIRNIYLEGNKRTKSSIVYREITVRAGDTISVNRLMAEMEKSENQLMNTGLFNEVVLNIKNWNGDSLDILVVLKERWYTIPLPALNLYDRNFNVWWVDHDHDLRWLQAGIRFYQKNLTGRNDDLRLTALFGFQQQFEAAYILPYFDYIQKHGLSFSNSYTRTRNIPYAIDSNKELIYEDVNAYQRESFSTNFDIFYKPGFIYRYTLSLGYRYSEIADTIAALNPDYFLNGNTIQQYLSARVSFVRDNRDLKAYPLRGDYVELSVSKLGFGLFDDVDVWQTYITAHKYFQLSRQWFLSTQNKLKLSFPKEQPYNFERGLGYGGDYVSGYEYYAINGESFAYTKLNLKNEIVKITFRSPENNVLTKGANLPFALYGRAFIDAGHVWDGAPIESNSLSNTLLLGGGLGLDLVMIYDTALRLEYSINKLGETGLFFHFSTFF